MGGMGSGRPRDAARRAEILRLRTLGLTFAEIGRRLGVTRQCAQALSDGLAADRDRERRRRKREAARRARKPPKGK